MPQNSTAQQRKPITAVAKQNLLLSVSLIPIHKKSIVDSMLKSTIFTDRTETVDLKNKVHLNSMLQIEFINSLQQLLKKQS